MSGQITTLIGLPRAGKSTFAKRWMEEYYRTEYGMHRVVLNRDNLRLAIHGQRFKEEAENFVHAVTMAMLKALLMQDMHVLVDECNTTKDSIKGILKLDANAEFIYLDTPIEVCKQRAYASNQPDLVEAGVIDRFHTNLGKLVRNNHPDIAIRNCGLRTDSELLTKENILASIEEIRKRVST